MRLTKSPCHVPERLKYFKRSLFLLDTCIDILKWRKIFVLDVSLRETKVYNGEVSLFLLFSFSRKIKWKKKRRKLWKFCLTWNSEKDEIQLTISCARTRCWWSMQLILKKKYFYNNAMQWWWCSYCTGNIRVFWNTDSTTITIINILRWFRTF